MPGGGAVTGAPRNDTSPALGAVSPATICSSVDLPQPDGPTMATNSPSSTSSAMFPSATVVAAPLPKVFCTPVSRRWVEVVVAAFMRQYASEAGEILAALELELVCGGAVAVGLLLLDAAQVIDERCAERARDRG